MIRKFIRLMRRSARTALTFLVDVIAMNRFGREFIDLLLNIIMERTYKVLHNGVELVFTTPNGVSWTRADSFSLKEPETLEWLDSMEERSVIWDVGANVGLYSCYAAKLHGAKVYAFEPSVFNLELLSRNVFLNDLSENIVIVPLPLSEQLTTSTLNMSMTEWGGALSTFGESYTHDGTQLNKVFEFTTIGLSMDDAISKLDILQPDYIKMDVDGIEHLILKGGISVLSEVKGVLIEINDEFEKQAEDTLRYLTEAGLELLDKRHSEMFDDSTVFNQIWQRKSAT